VYEYNGHGRVIGSAGALNEGAVEAGSYCEVSYSGHHVVVESSTNGYVNIAAGPFTSVLGTILVPNASDSRISGLTIDALGVRLDRKISTVVNSTVVALEFLKSYVFSQSSAASNVTLNLPAITSSGLFASFDMPIQIVFENIGGKTFTIKSPDNTVNRVAGATGITHTGNYVSKEARYNPSYGWIVT
jgi:hypothetical protein